MRMSGRVNSPNAFRQRFIKFKEIMTRYENKTFKNLLLKSNQHAFVVYNFCKKEDIELAYKHIVLLDQNDVVFIDNPTNKDIIVNKYPFENYKQNKFILTKSGLGIK